mmetsp:Transcript_16976/g.14864  ORF Transcript_16976/g.14864 Transcript_16976/m.14864 type:complete len:102 (-) Transcript_16976:323-628(-)
MFYYNWFLKDFVHKKIIISEEEADELFDEETFSVHSADFINLMKTDNTIFQDDSSVIHMSGNSSDLGKIINMNKATTKIFGYTRDELLNGNIGELMPKIFA